MCLFNVGFHGHDKNIKRYETVAKSYQEYMNVK